MDTRKFLGRVLPSSGGDYFSNYKAPDGKLRQSPPLKTLEALISDIERRRAERVDVFYGTGVYDGSRKANKTLLKKALYVDVDTAGSHAGYPTKRAAAEAVAAFHRSSGFPLPNMVVDSGRGLHFYWTFTEPVSGERWHRAASALKSLCASHEFAVDASITGDPARILRVPGTLNFKDPTSPLPCVLLKADPADFDIAELEANLGLSTHGGTGSEGADLDVNDDLGGNLYAEREYHASEIFEKCEVMKHTRATGGKDQAGLLWFRLLHLLAYTTDGGEYIHEISKEHADYSSETVERRFSYAKEQKAKGTGPTLCATLEGFLPSKCAVCPSRGKIKTPLVLGRKDDALYPASYRITDEGVFKKIQVPGSTDVELNLVIPYKLHNVELLFNASGKSLKFDATYKGKTQTLVVPTVTLVGDGKELAAAMMFEDIMLGDTAIKEFKQLMIPWMRQLNAVKEVTKTAITGMGWVDRSTTVGFAAGTTIHLEDGTREMVSGLDRQLCKEYDPDGTPQAWQDLRDVVVADQDPAIVTTVLTAFAAPLIKFTGVNGVLYSICSRESGTGKSTALRVAQAVWGDPKRGINALNDTVLSVSKKMGFLNNLPAYWDEVRMRDEVQNFVKMIFRLGQGKERSRLQSSTKFQEMGTWATITTVATNEPIRDHIDRVAGNTNAGRLRIFEVHVPARTLAGANVSALSQQVDRNYGHAGFAYAGWLARNGRKLEPLVVAQFDRVEADLQATKDERFWVAFVATTLVAAAICQKEGLLVTDLGKLKAWLYMQFKKQRGGSQEKFQSLESRAAMIIITFAEKFRDQLLVVDAVPTIAAPNVLPTVTVQPVNKEIVGMIGSSDHILRLKKEAFETYVYELGESPSQIMEQLVAHGARMSRGIVTAGLANTTNVKVPVIDVCLTDPVFDTIGVIGK
jgi:hypothetical protein